MGGWHDYFTRGSEHALDQVELPKVRRAQSLIDDMRSPDEDGYTDFIDPRSDARLEELENIVDGLTPDDIDSESDFERVRNS